MKTPGWPWMSKCVPIRPQDNQDPSRQLFLGIWRLLTFTVFFPLSVMNVSCSLQLAQNYSIKLAELDIKVGRTCIFIFSNIDVLLSKWRAFIRLPLLHILSFMLLRWGLDQSSTNFLSLIYTWHHINSCSPTYLLNPDQLVNINWINQFTGCPQINKDLLLGCGRY